MHATDYAAPRISPKIGATSDALRAVVRAAGIKRVARISGVPRSKVQAFVNQGAVPQRKTVAKLEAAQARLGA